MVYRTPHTHRPHSHNLGTKFLMATSLAMVLGFLLFDMESIATGGKSSKTAAHATDCNNIVSNQAQLSREQLAKLLTIPERDAKSKVRQVVDEPYCQLPPLKVRSGVDAEREAYPLAFDPSTTLVILYENDEYAGYRFSFE